MDFSSSLVALLSRCSSPCLKPFLPDSPLQAATLIPHSSHHKRYVIDHANSCHLLQNCMGSILDTYNPLQPTGLIFLKVVLKKFHPSLQSCSYPPTLIVFFHSHSHPLIVVIQMF